MNITVAVSIVKVELFAWVVELFFQFYG